jgi:glutamyl-Q tRNA(Asp) synthetase
MALLRYGAAMIVSRFAPSPTGYLHLGHAFSAWSACESADCFLLRIEDLDAGRCRPEFEAAIFEDLAWLGLRWEAPVRRQSEHMADYAAALQQLIARGLVYRDFRTRRELAEESVAAPHGAADIVRGGPAPDEAARLAAGAPFAWRLSLDRARAALGDTWDALQFEADGVTHPANPARLGDVVLARKDFPASYHLASVLDDALQGVTLVVRGEDLADAAHLHVLLQALLGLPTPRYRHHRLILGPDGKRLAKRDRAQTLRALRESGATAQDVWAMLR